MSIKIIRGMETTDYVQNTDDSRLFRYAVGGYNGVTKNYANECGYEEIGNIFKIKSGEIVKDGWQAKIDSNGVSLTLLNSGTRLYYTIYCKYDFSVTGVYTATIESLYDTSDYPAIPTSDDLTTHEHGIAYQALYHVSILSGVIDAREAIFDLIEIGNSKHAETADDSTNATNAINAEKGVKNTDGTYQRLFKATSSDDDYLSLGGNRIRQVSMTQSPRTTELSVNSATIAVTFYSYNFTSGKKYIIDGGFYNALSPSSFQPFSIQVTYLGTETIQSNGLLPILTTTGHTGVAYGVPVMLTVQNSGANVIITAYSQEYNSGIKQFASGTGLTITRIYKVIE